jgi:uncharacterized damage-inducible protein DinB
MRILVRKERNMEQTQSTLGVIYENWRDYNAKLRNAIAPLTDEQLKLQPAPTMWPIQQMVQHIVSVRAGWFSGTLQDEDAAMTEYMEWGQRESPKRTAAELAHGLDETWAFIESRVKRWTPEDCAQTFPDEYNGEVWQVSRSWVTYHVLEHDLHHGGEISMILSMHGVKGVDI